MTSTHGIFFSAIDGFWKNLRTFSYRNRGVFEAAFIMVYTLEQVALVLSTYFIRDVTVFTLAVSIFALVVLTTFSLHKLVMESRIKVLESEFNRTIIENEKQLQRIDVLHEEYQHLRRARRPTNQK